MIPVLTTFANSLEKINDLFQALGEPIQRLIGLLTIGMGAKILGNFFIRGSTGRGLGAQGSTNLMNSLSLMGAGVSKKGSYVKKLPKPNIINNYTRPEDPLAARLERKRSIAQQRGSTSKTFFSKGVRPWVPNAGMPWGSSFDSFNPMTSAEVANSLGTGLSAGRFGVPLTCVVYSALCQ